MIRKKCYFCDCRGARALCDWPTRHRGEVAVEELKVGDIWIAESNKRGTIVEIEDFDLTRRFWILRQGNREPFSYNRFRGDLQTCERIEKCAKACCFRHRRRIGQDHYYCAEHWSAWETVS